MIESLIGGFALEQLFAYSICRQTAVPGVCVVLFCRLACLPLCCISSSCENLHKLNEISRLQVTYYFN